MEIRNFKEVSNIEFTEMSQVRSSGLYVVRDGKLVLKEEMEQRGEKVIEYAHTVRPPPDQYYTTTIKEYRR